MNQARIGKAREEQSSDAPKQQFRCESALRGQGVDEAFIAQRLVDMLQAKGKRWNAATKSWETFEDYGTQLAAVKEAAKILGLYPTQKELDSKHKPSEVIIRLVEDQPWRPQGGS